MLMLMHNGHFKFSLNAVLLALHGVVLVKKTVVKNHFLQFHGLNTTSKNGEMY